MRVFRQDEQDFYKIFLGCVRRCFSCHELRIVWPFKGCVSSGTIWSGQGYHEYLALSGLFTRVLSSGIIWNVQGCHEFLDCLARLMSS